MRLNATTRKLPSGFAFPANFTTGGLISPRLFLGWRLHNMLSIIAFIGGAAIGGFAVGIPAVLEIRRINSRGWEWYPIADNEDSESSAGRRVGNECASTCRARWTPDIKKQNAHNEQKP